MGNIEHFNKMAAGYDSPERQQVAAIIAAAIRELLADGRNKTAIDYGCGTGLVGLQLLNDFKRIIFIDGSSQMVEELEQKIKRLQIPAAKAEVLCLNLEEESAPPLQADYIMVVQTLLHIKNYQSVLMALAAMLKQDGHLIIVDFNKNEAVSSDLVHNGFEQVQLINQLKDLSFKQVSGKTFYEGANLFMKQAASLFIVDAIK
ncbi:MAG: class I SAM-dependent methyltransferase [Spirochaetaceae bacterium]|nr:class I SAM-dependent methyltransferase [Spirochaetaceae bacterium]